LLEHAGLVTCDESDESAPSVEAAICVDDRLSDEQKTALIAVFRSMIQPT
jgi:hypothetical protein